MLTVPNIAGLSWNDAAAAINNTCSDPSKPSTCLHATAGNFRAQAYEQVFPTIPGATKSVPGAGRRVRPGTTIAIYF
jgi:hypothetical protein